MNKLKLFFAFLSVSMGIVAMPRLAMAQYAPRVTIINPLSVDKLVKPINDERIKDFVDNIDASQKLFVKGDIFEYKIVVKNVGTSAISDVAVTDYLPKYLSLVFYPGTFDKNTNEIKFTVDALAANESKEYIIRAKLDEVPTTKVIGNKIKLTNRSTGRVLGFSDTDTASFYVALTVVPATGASDIVIKTVLVLMTAGTGFGVRKFIRGY
jgi:uncharacterized repeat protein (TIGR01451 family)